MGKRIHRGLFKCSKGIDISEYIGSKKKKIFDTINADVQGAYNTLRNVDPRFNKVRCPPPSGAVIHEIYETTT